MGNDGDVLIHVERAKIERRCHSDFFFKRKKNVPKNIRSQKCQTNMEVNSKNLIKKQASEKNLKTAFSILLK